MATPKDGSIPKWPDWYEALEDIDKRGNKDALVKLLQSDREMPRGFRYPLGDLLDRHKLKKKRGRPRLPSYDRSLAEVRVFWAITYARTYVKDDRMKVRDAIAKAAAQFDMSENVVANAYAGRRGSMRRVARREPKPTKPSDR
jgi:hypothetical protein